MNNAAFNRVWWHSRRGMRELDLVLLPFLENCFRQLDGPDQSAYLALLEQEDQDLFRWLIGSDSPADDALLGIIKRIRDYAVTLDNSPS